MARSMMAVSERGTCWLEHYRTRVLRAAGNFLNDNCRTFWIKLHSPKLGAWRIEMGKWLPLQRWLLSTASFHSVGQSTTSFRHGSYSGLDLGCPGANRSSPAHLALATVALNFGYDFF